MLCSFEVLQWMTPVAKDGEFGKIIDVYFDDQQWTARYLVIDTANWLPGRKILLSPRSLGKPDIPHRLMPVGLTQEQIRSAPTPDSDLPVSRQFEERFSGFYGYQAYWQERGDATLRSAMEIKGYHILAQDGEFGHIVDFLLDDLDWSIKYLAIDTRNWLPSRISVVPSEWAKDIRFENRQVVMDHFREEVRNSPQYSPVLLTPEFEAALARYYDKVPSL